MPPAVTISGELGRGVCYAIAVFSPPRRRDDGPRRRSNRTRYALPAAGDAGRGSLRGGRVRSLSSGARLRLAAGVTRSVAGVAWLLAAALGALGFVCAIAIRVRPGGGV